MPQLLEGLGELIGPVIEFGAEAAAPVAEFGAEAAPIAGEALNILPEAAQFTSAAVGDVLPIAAEGAATGGLGFGGTGLGGAIGSDVGGLVSGAPVAFGGETAITPRGFDVQPQQAQAFSGGSGQDVLMGGRSLDELTTPGISQSVVPGTGTTAAAVAGPPGAGAGVDMTSEGVGKWASDFAGEGVAGGTGGGGGFNLIDSITNSVKNNPLGIALGAGGLGYNIINGMKQSGAVKDLVNQARSSGAEGAQTLAQGRELAGQNAQTGQRLEQQGEALTQYLQTGQLPPQYNQIIDQALSDAKTKAISNAAAQGMPTDPNKNTTLAQQLASIDNQRAGLVTQVAQQLFNSGSSLISQGTGTTTNTAGSLLSSGASAAGLSGQLLSTIANLDQKQSQLTGQAIANLAAAMNTRSTNAKNGLNINIGGSASA